MMVRVASLAFVVAVASVASAQTYYATPFSLAQRNITVSLGGYYQPSTRYLQFTVRRNDSPPASLINWFNSTYAPYWSLTNGSVSSPGFVANDLHVQNSSSGVFIDSASVGSTGIAQFKFSGEWLWPLISYPENPTKYYALNGRNYWEVVVKQDWAGQYSLYTQPYGSGGPSYYSLGPGQFDDYFSNRQTAPYCAKMLNLAVYKDVRPYQNQTERYYIMLCSWSQNGPYIGMTVKGGLLATTYNGYQAPITPD